MLPLRRVETRPFEIFNACDGRNRWGTQAANSADKEVSGLYAVGGLEFPDAELFIEACVFDLMVEPDLFRDSVAVRDALQVSMDFGLGRKRATPGRVGGKEKE